MTEHYSYFPLTSFMDHQFQERLSHRYFVDAVEYDAVEIPSPIFPYNFLIIYKSKNYIE